MAIIGTNGPDQLNGTDQDELFEGGNGANVAVALATLVGAPTITAADVVLVYLSFLD